MERAGFESVTFFTGVEVENTPAIGCQTLFVVGLASPNDILAQASIAQAEQIYFGANHSYQPCCEDEVLAWESMIRTVQERFDHWVTLDLDVANIDHVLESAMVEDPRFIPMISVKMPYLNQLGLNATLKIDDTDFAKSNPGVWCYNLHSLTGRGPEFTAWHQYSGDKPTS